MIPSLRAVSARRPSGALEGPADEPGLEAAEALAQRLAFDRRPPRSARARRRAGLRGARARATARARPRRARRARSAARHAPRPCLALRGRLDPNRLSALAPRLRCPLRTPEGVHLGTKSSRDPGVGPCIHGVRRARLRRDLLEEREADRGALTWISSQCSRTRHGATFHASEHRKKRTTRSTRPDSARAPLRPRQRPSHGLIGAFTLKGFVANGTAVVGPLPTSSWTESAGGIPGPLGAPQ